MVISFCSTKNKVDKGIGLSFHLEAREQIMKENDWQIRLNKNTLYKVSDNLGTKIDGNTVTVILLAANLTKSLELHFKTTTKVVNKITNF